jgi:Molybdopterin biosynthesis enzyme
MVKPVKVETGAVIPDKTEANLMEEMVNIQNKNITFKKNIKKNPKHKICTRRY